MDNAGSVYLGHDLVRPRQWVEADGRFTAMEEGGDFGVEMAVDGCLHVAGLVLLGDPSPKHDRVVLVEMDSADTLVLR